MLYSIKLDSAIKEVDSVVLLAGLVECSITKKHPEETALINDQGLKAVIDNCAEKNNK